MEFIRKHGNTLYFLILAIQCIAICSGWESVRIISKAALIPMLTWHLVSVAGSAAPPAVYIGLLFAYLGDIALLQEGNLYFMAGMACFIVSHISYSVYFSRLQDSGNNRLREAFAAGVVLILISATLFAILNPYLGSLRIPVLCYMVIISIMAILASNTAANAGLRAIAFSCFIPGAALFVVSDGSLALNKFVFHTQWLNVAVMFTYGLAQFLLARGFARVALRFLSAS